MHDVLVVELEHVQGWRVSACVEIIPLCYPFEPLNCVWQGTSWKLLARKEDMTFFLLISQRSLKIGKLAVQIIM